VLLVFRIRGFFFPIFFAVFFCCESWWGHCPWIVFGQIYFTLFMIYASRLRFYEPFFFYVVFCFCSLLIFFSQPNVNITWITGHIHRSIVDKIDLTSEYVEMVKKDTLSITLEYIVLWNVIRRIYLIVKNTFDEPWRAPPPLFITSKLEEWLMMKYVLENCLLDLFVVLDLDLGSILIDNSFFLSLKSWI
jgi:hypothetical protein